MERMARSHPRVAGGFANGKRRRNQFEAVKEISAGAARLLEPIFEAHEGKNGASRFKRIPVSTRRPTNDRTSNSLQPVGAKPDPEIFESAGIAVFKKIYKVFRERGYRARLLAAAFRNDMHWSELVGGNIVISPPHKWQVRFNAGSIDVRPRIDDAVDPAIVKALDSFEDFRKAYSENGLSVDQFDVFPPTRRTLRQFISACQELNSLIRDVMIPNPDDEVPTKAEIRVLRR